jgi:hypothetical protein
MKELLVVALAAWRLASLLSREDGPAGILSTLREKAGLRRVVLPMPSGQNWATITVATTPWAELLDCLWCLSVWTAGLAWLFERFSLGRWLNRLLAASALAILVEKAVDDV